ncbi:uncharacterized protein [Euphorbia lathyris]|uniref:uncharacterized protein isoform X1 n=1 Tax=Euphorbia lathyris TaxID=212925 RepID=UPI0033131A30
MRMELFHLAGFLGIIYRDLKRENISTSKQLMSLMSTLQKTLVLLYGDSQRQKRQLMPNEIVVMVPEDILVKGVVGCRQVKIFFFTNSVFAEFGLADQNKKLGDIAASHLLNLWSGKASSGGASWELS